MNEKFLIVTTRSVCFVGHDYDLPQTPAVRAVSYRAGTYGMDHIGISTGAPRLICDGCGITRPVQPHRGGPSFAWLMDGTPAPGWAGERDLEGFTRKDWCGPCARNAGKKTYGKARS